MPSSADIAAALRELGSATLGESGARAMRDRVKPVWSGARLAAPAYPVRCTTGDNLAIHVAVARAPGGSALVVDVGTERELGYWGEVLTTAAESRGIVGLVIDGCVRDTEALEAHGFPVFSAGIALRGASKSLEGTITTPSRSPTTQSPGFTSTSATTAGRSTVPSSVCVAPRNAIPALTTGKPCASSAAVSRTQPSITSPTMPRDSAAVVSTSPQ